MEEALYLFMRAIDLDPEFAIAHTMAACCYGTRKATGCMTDPAKDLPEAERLARRAVALGPDNAFALAGSGWAMAYVVGDLDAGCAMVDRALALSPNVADGWLWGGWIKIWLGEPEEAITCLERGMRLSPLNPYLWIAQVGAAHAHFFAGRYDEASSCAATALQSAPDHPIGMRIHAASTALAGQLQRAQRSVTSLLRRTPTLTVSGLKGVLGPYRRAEDLARYEEGLRRAGLPE